MDLWPTPSDEYHQLIGTVLALILTIVSAFWYPMQCVRKIVQEEMKNSQATVGEFGGLVLGLLKTLVDGSDALSPATPNGVDAEGGKREKGWTAGDKNGSCPYLGEWKVGVRSHYKAYSWCTSKREERRRAGTLQIPK